jgi:ribose transport system permease protein
MSTRPIDEKAEGERRLVSASDSTAVTGPGSTAGQPGGPKSMRTGPSVGTSRRRGIGSFLGRYGVLIAFLITIAFFSIARSDSFFTTDNLESIITTAAPPMILAVGLTVVLVMNDFDLSIGAMVSLAGGAAVALMANEGVNWILAVIIALGLGVAVGLINGYLIAYLGASSFVITLAMSTVLLGVEYIFTSNKTIFQGVSLDYAEIGRAEILGLSIQIWFAAAVSGVLWLFLDRTELGRFMYAIGSSPEAARLSGVRTRQIRVLGFVIVAVAAAFVGVILTAQGASYTPNTGPSYLLPAFAAAFLGSAAFRPGQFNVPGTVVGVLFLGTLSTGLTMMNLESYLINIVQGVILILAILLSLLEKRTA